MDFYTKINIRILKILSYVQHLVNMTKVIRQKVFEFVCVPLYPRTYILTRVSLR